LQHPKMVFFFSSRISYKLMFLSSPVLVLAEVNHVIDAGVLLCCSGQWCSYEMENSISCLTKPLAM